MFNITSTINRLNDRCNILTKLSEQLKGDDFVFLKDDLFYEIISTFNPVLTQQNAKQNLKDVYTVAYHPHSGVLLISNNGATLFSHSPKTETTFITRHLGIEVIIPNHGQEFVNVGIVGDIYTVPFVLRAESACTPSFLFGSQRCNCAHQWAISQELAAYFNQITPPNIKDGTLFEKWVKEQVDFSPLTWEHISNYQSEIGFLLMHIDTQNGMGSGSTSNEFIYDLFGRSSLRHRGEYTSEQIFEVSMAGGFTSLGLEPDPRSHNEQAGYKVIPLVLDFLNVYKDVIFLTNNPLKVNMLKNANYKVDRVKVIGLVNAAGAQEAKERGIEFGHLDINENEISFETEFDRLKEKIRRKITYLAN